MALQGNCARLIIHCKYTILQCTVYAQACMELVACNEPVLIQ